jgi:2-haloacid dehalogenase
MEDQITKPQIIVFDVYETMFDMTDMERRINTVVDSKRGYTLWFAMFSQYCFADNSLDTHHDFFSIAKASLQMTGHQLGRPVSKAEAEDVLELLEHLPIHEDVQESLSQLNDKGYRISALTNVPENIVCDRMERTGLISYFENVLSAEKVKKYKPEKIVYKWASEKLMADPDQILMVTAHGWDIAGAANAGMKTAFLKRGRQSLFPLSADPDMVCKSFIELASLL